MTSFISRLVLYIDICYSVTNYTSRGGFFLYLKNDLVVKTNLTNSGENKLYSVLWTEIRG